MLKILGAAILVATLAGCLPIGIRGSSLPNYADAPATRCIGVGVTCHHIA